MSNELPWSERVAMLSIHPDAASREDVARLAAELMGALRSIENLEHESKALAHLHRRCVDKRDAAEARAVQFAKVLEPFARLADEMRSCEDHAPCDIRVADLRRARMALSAFDMQTDVKLCAHCGAALDTNGACLAVIRTGKNR